MIEENIKILVTKNFSNRDLSFNFDKTSDERGLYEKLIESSPSKIIHFAGPDGYYAELLCNDDTAALLVPNKVYDDPGFQELLFDLREFGLCSITTIDFGYNISVYECK